MSGDRSHYTSRAVESPLDLTVKRFDMQDPADAIQNIQNYEYDGYSTYNNTASIPMNTEYQYGHYPQNSAPEVDYQYDNSYCSNIPYSQEQGFHTTSIPMPSSSFMNHTGSYTTTMISSEDQDSLESYPSSGTQSYSPPCESSIIPKKRKNLWRPYDNRLIQVSDAEEKESDSGSDSMSGSPSDQESKNRSPPPDMVKKRKIHRTHLNYKTFSADDNQMKSGKERQHDVIRRNSAGVCEVTNVPSTSKAYTAPIVDASKGEALAEPNTVLKLTDPAQAAEHRDKMISGMKKRDIFGWSLKLKDPAVSEDRTVEDEMSISSLKEKERVCKDGEKTYIELQTVKKSTSEPSQLGDINAESKYNRSQPLQKESNLTKSENIKRKNKDIIKADTKVNNIEQENDDSNYVGKKVYIQHRDNILECCNESDVKEKEKPQTKSKGISLIDLIEEIEASAKHQDKDEIEKTNRRNRNVAKLLDQCNFVKLRALDFLMANVLIQDKQNQVKPKNEKVQKMLKGDKINSVSMLDVVELQVEMGLN